MELNNQTLANANLKGKIKLHYGVSRVIGSRNHQEDEYTCIDNSTTSNGAAYFAVFDGHGSDLFSAHASNNTHNFVFASDYFVKGDFSSAIVDGLKQEDRELFKLYSDSELGGSTATVSLIANDTLYLANLGDSTSAVGVEVNGRVYCQVISQDHKPDDPEEKARIEAAGGVVVADRVIGVARINMSRAMGDFTFKMPMNHESGDWITSQPYIMDPLPITENMKFLIIASDGVWNSIGETVVSDIDQLQKQGLSPTDIAKQVVNKCGSVLGADNTTVIIVFFDFKGDMFQGMPHPPHEPRISSHSAQV